MGKVRTLALGVPAALLLAAGVAGAATSIVLPKPGQVGIGFGAGYGGFASGENVGNVFGNGPSFCVRGRYRMRYERAIGLSFEGQQLDARLPAPLFDPADQSTVAPTRLSLITSGVEFYQMFGTRTHTTRMLMVGAGIAQMRAKDNTGEIDLVTNGGDGVYVSGGGGVERFFYRSWAYDLSARYLAVFRDGKPNHDLQAALGVIFYASY